MGIGRGLPNSHNPHRQRPEGSGRRTTLGIGEFEGVRKATERRHAGCARQIRVRTQSQIQWTLGTPSAVDRISAILGTCSPLPYESVVRSTPSNSPAPLSRLPRKRLRRDYLGSYRPVIKTTASGGSTACLRTGFSRMRSPGSNRLLSTLASVVTHAVLVSPWAAARPGEPTPIGAGRPAPPATGAAPPGWPIVRLPEPSSTWDTLWPAGG